MKCIIGKKNKSFLSKKMFGLFFEDINYGADGGLYAEMLENRQFAFRKALPGKTEKTYETEWVCGYGWEKYPAESVAEMVFREGDALSANNPHYMVFTVSENTAGFTNKAYDGICLKKDAVYKISLWLRARSYCGGISIRIEDRASGRICAEDRIPVTPSGEWTLYELNLKAESGVRNGRFLVEQETGSVEYGFLSMMPQDAVAGVFRRDLYEMLAEMRPGFLRFPGGCIVEGANLDNRYRWKDTVGKVWDRKWNWSRWAVHDVTMGQGEPLYFPFYNQSYGIGFYEYFLLCELLQCKPLPVLNVGLACQFQSDELVPVDAPEFQEYLQDALDLIEFANGTVDTKWGALRAQMGHPAPFGLEYVGIGNEQWETEQVDFFARYTAFEKAIHAVYPDIELLGSAGPDVTTERYTRAWEYYRESCKGHSRFAAAVDEHYYMPPAWFYEHVDMYDSYSREIPVFAGEYAAHCSKKQNNMEAALAEAAFMCGLERNGDVIRFASAAPLFARKGYEQWIPDYIWFDGEQVMGTPGYYVQKMFARYTGFESREFCLENAPDKVYGAVSADGRSYYVKLINTGAEPVELEEISIEGKRSLLQSSELLQMKADHPEDENKLGQGDGIALRSITAGDKVLLPGYSCTAIVIHKE